MDRPRLILTGATGFLGRSVIGLLSQNYEVYEIHRSIQSHGGDRQRVIHWQGDIEALSRDVAKVQPSVVVHLAAHYAPRARVEELHDMIGASVGLTLGILEGLREQTCHIVSVGTRFQRLRSGKAISVYAALKNCQEELILQYVSESMSATFLEMGDLYGPGDNRGKLIEQMARAANESKPFRLSHPMNFIFPIYVADAVQAVLTSVSLSGTSLARYSVVGAEGGVTVAAVASLIPGLRIDTSVADAGESSFRGDTDKFLGQQPPKLPPVPGWRPDWALERGIQALRESLCREANTPIMPSADHPGGDSEHAV